MKEKNPKQIKKFDGKNVFMEVMNAFEIGKVQMNFIEYNPNAEKKARQTKKIEIFVDIDKALLLAQDILSGRMQKLGAEATKVAEAESARTGRTAYAKDIFSDLGGVSAKKLAERGKTRADGKSLSRQLKITPGNKKPWLLSGEQGAGEENDTGLIVPSGRSEEIVRVAFTNDDFKILGILIQTHIQAYLAGQYAKEAINPTPRKDYSNQG